MMWKKNPNMYFYRHNEPGIVSSVCAGEQANSGIDYDDFQEQWTGDWTEDEKSIFLNVSRQPEVVSPISY